MTKGKAYECSLDLLDLTHTLDYAAAHGIKLRALKVGKIELSLAEAWPATGDAKDDEPAAPDPLERLQGMSPLEQDAALMLGRLDQ